MYVCLYVCMYECMSVWAEHILLSALGFVVGVAFVAASKVHVCVCVCVCVRKPYT